MNKGQYDQYNSNNYSVEMDKEPVILNHQKIDVQINNDANNDSQNPENQNNIQNQAPEGAAENQQNNEDVRESNISTLDESITETFKRDVMKIVYKLEHVLLPRFNATKGKELQNWDLWGPLIFCLILCLTISYTPNQIDEKEKQQVISSTGSVFIIIFAIVWIGGIIITLNSQFLGAKFSFFQCLCLLGYCIFPINIAAILIRTIDLLKYIKLIIIALGFFWSCLSSVGFISGLVQPDKKLITVYPVFLFFLVLSWFALNLNDTSKS